MSVDLATWGHLEKLTWQHVLLALAVLVAARLLSFLLRGLLRRVAESASPHLRLSILRAMPIVRLLIGVAAVILIVCARVGPAQDIDLATYHCRIGVAQVLGRVFFQMKHTL